MGGVSARVTGCDRDPRRPRSPRARLVARWRGRGRAAWRQDRVLGAPRPGRASPGRSLSAGARGGLRAARVRSHPGRGAEVQEEGPAAVPQGARVCRPASQALRVLVCPGGQAPRDGRLPPRGAGEQRGRQRDRLPWRLLRQPRCDSDEHSECRRRSALLRCVPSPALCVPGRAVGLARVPLLARLLRRVPLPHVAPGVAVLLPLVRAAVAQADCRHCRRQCAPRLHILRRWVGAGLAACVLSQPEAPR